MRRDPVVLFDDGTHQCLMFDDLVTGDGVQSNQFLITNSGQSILLDPGGDLTFTPLNIEISRYISSRSLTYIFASHQDPDIIAALDKWLLHTPAKVITSKLWARFLPHLSAAFLTQNHGIKTSERVISVPDSGAQFNFGNTTLSALPAHFLHSVGNLQLFDPTSKILFSGDMGASLLDDGSAVESFAEHIPSMLGFHQRYMVSKQVTRLWANMVRQLDVEMIVPQHGRFFKGKIIIEQFLNWIENLNCGIDLVNQHNYQPPQQLLNLV
ncbi:FprA family A-type flavoprotein [Thiopseudomonas alkaliphila]|uniref:FprA family A-type flavoprotein n=1 Tax=Thiopseudomonas alkaliphila TaxID=1697053 RepID=A0AAW7DVR0_9GAMM|nr:MBL fold metallo-hydrolase [Thiopseudomonas alkaliphila]MDM1697078.1 FprA family A-type flavoprotein [Thiopseudomonas alkaliphila]